MCPVFLRKAVEGGEFVPIPQYPFWQPVAGQRREGPLHSGRAVPDRPPEPLLLSSLAAYGVPRFSSVLVIWLARW